MFKTKFAKKNRMKVAKTVFMLGSFLSFKKEIGSYSKSFAKRIAGKTKVPNAENICKTIAAPLIADNLASKVAKGKMGSL